MKRLVKDYSVQVIGKAIQVDITTDRKRPHNYRIVADTRHPNIFEIAEKLDQRLSQAKQLGAKVEIREYFERMYIFIDSIQYSATER